MMWGEREEDNDLERGNGRGWSSLIIAERSFIYRMEMAAVIFSARKRRKCLRQRAQCVKRIAWFNYVVGSLRHFGSKMIRFDPKPSVPKR
jgi:hypothetical protein